jgi:hypothetical protein
MSSMISDELEVQFDERRSAPRTSIDGRYTMRLDPRDGREPFTCAVLDYSVTGARLQVPQDIALPAELHVIIGMLSHKARVVWRNGPVVGIDFVDEHYSIF